MAQCRKYERYKDSGVEWIGEIPEGWTKRKLTWIFDVIGSGTTPTSSNTEYYDGDIPWLITGDLNDGIICSTSKTVTTLALTEYSSLKLYPENSLVVAMYGATIGKLGLTKIRTTTNQACCVMAYPINSDVRYMFYWFLGNRKEIINLSQGGGQPNISQDIIRSLRVYCPPIDEQIQIADFLDQKTAEIDSLIADKEKLIALLEEQRQAIITEAVTKGLNPDVKMKDSGVEWIDNIPEYWCVSKLSHVALVKARLGWKGLTASEYVDDGYIFLATPNIKTNKIDFENVNYITAERYYESPEIMLDLNDVLLAKDGSTLGTVNVIRELPRPATVNSSIAVIRPQQEKLSGVFLYYFLASNYMQNVIQRMKDGMGVPHLFQRDINKFDILVPPLEEQIQIVDFLEKKTAEISCLVAEIEEQIIKLREYRQSLIFEAVTGKIDIRDTIVEPTVV